jgi:hypothetical protein
MKGSLVVFLLQNSFRILRLLISPFLIFIKFIKRIFLQFLPIKMFVGVEEKEYPSLGDKAVYFYNLI